MSIFNLKGALVGLLATMTIDGFTSTLYKLQLAAPVQERLLGRWFCVNSHWGMSCLPEA